MTDPAVSWQPTADLTQLRARAELLARLRAFFSRCGVLEVETPLLSRYANVDPAIDSLAVTYSGPSAAASRWLHTSPEFAMKRLLAAGSGPIYQICKAFRDGEEGRLHNPEFSLLEWYRPGFDHLRLMDEVAELVGAVAEQAFKVERYRYFELLQQHIGCDPDVLEAEDLADLARSRGIDCCSTGLSRDAWLDVLMSHLIEPYLGQGCLSFVYDYPASQAALARVERDEGRWLARRFELYMRGVEIANGFYELADAQEQRRRFEADNALRRQQGRREMPMDELLLAALESGLPDCAGVALGIDRLLMALQGADSVHQVIAFPIGRA